MKIIIKIVIIILISLSAFYFIFLEYKKIYSRINTLENSLELSQKSIDQISTWKTNQIQNNRDQSNSIRQTNSQNSKLNRELKINQKYSSELENKISKLENKISKLENKLPKKTNKLNYKEKWLNISNWRKLNTGMSESEVIKLLGEPHKRNTNIFIEYVYEGYGYRGLVSISTIKSDYYGGVKAWTEPDF